VDVAQIREQVAAATQILLFIHGVIGNTRTMAGTVNRLVDGQALGAGFLVLTFDYENLNTPIRDIAATLRSKLTAVGLGRQHDKALTLIAHSMGGLVARWLIEKEAAAPPVSRLIMLGVPNGGSPLQHIRQWTQGILTLTLNGIALVKLAGLGLPVLAGILARDYDTLDELAPDSATLQALYTAPDPQVPYVMIAGDTRTLGIVLDDRDSPLNRLLSVLKQQGRQAVADLFTRNLFGDEPNDIAVAHSSMRHLAPGRQPAMTFYVTDCDHLSYFEHLPAIERLARLLREQGSP
ncbi:MAG TPA: alpha/beta fold hydrolase, partial [Thiolinea sp.]|nr:alpha/beta fold hydrolase [Thiolinea sp.]